MWCQVGNEEFHSEILPEAPVSWQDLLHQIVLPEVAEFLPEKEARAAGFNIYIRKQR